MHILWAAWTALFYLQGDNSLVRYHDSGDGVIAAHFGLSLLKNFDFFPGYISQWISGTDFWSAGLVMPLGNILFRLIPPTLCYGIWMFSQKFIASFSMDLLLHRLLKIPRSISIPFSFLFALYPFTRSIENLDLPGLSFIDGFFIPGIAFTIILIEQKSTKLNTFLLFISTLFFSLGAYFIMGGFCLPALFVWHLIYYGKINLPKFLKTALVSFGMILCWLPFMLPPIFNAKNSQRALYSTAVGEQALNIQALVQFLSQNYYYYVIIALGLLFWRKGFWRAVIGVSAIAFLTLSLLMGGHYFASLKVFNTIRLERFALSLPFVLTIFSAMAFHSYYDFFTKKIRGKFPGGPFLAHWALGITYLLPLILSVEYHYVSMRRALYYSHTIKNLYLNPNLQIDEPKDEFRVATAFPWERPPAHVWAYGLQSVDGYLNMYSKQYHQLWEHILQDYFTHQPNDLSYFRTNGNRIYLFEKDLATKGKFEQFYSLEGLGLLNVKYIISKIPLRSDHLKLVNTPISQGDWFPRRASYLPLNFADLNTYSLETVLKIKDFIVSYFVNRYQFRHDIKKYIDSPPHVEEIFQYYNPFFVERFVCLEGLTIPDTSILSSPSFPVMHSLIKNAGQASLSVKSTLTHQSILEITTTKGCHLLLSLAHTQDIKMAIDKIEVSSSPYLWAFKRFFVPIGTHKVVVSH